MLAAFELLLKDSGDLPMPPPSRGDLLMVPFGVRPILQKTRIEVCLKFLIAFCLIDKWRPPRLSELTLLIFNTGLTHLSSEASKYSLYLHF